MTTVETLYERDIRPLPRAERLRLLAMIQENLDSTESDAPIRSLLELEGLGAALWQHIDPDEYVRLQREDWDRPSAQS